ncbi:HD domain-containing protein [bacterium]|nr:HD domain-containing protein [bacterium]
MRLSDLEQHKEYNLFKDVGAIADNSGLKAYLVGGFVRDLLLKRPCKDADILVVGDGVQFAQKVHEHINKGNFSYFKNFGTANIRMADGFEIEFVGARKESYQRGSRKPIVESGSFADDIARRDFTINTLAIALNEANFGELIDTYNGVADLRKGIIRTPLDAEITYSDDPLRMMRAVRFASQLRFQISEPSFEAITAQKDRIAIISQERISDELNKIMLSPKPSVGFDLLFTSGLLQYILPELTALYGVEDREGVSHKDNFYHTLKVLDNLSSVSGDLWLRWAALLHDVGKAPTKRFDKKAGWTFHGHEVVGARMVKTIFTRLKLPLGEQMKYVQKLVNLHLRPIALVQDVTDSAVRRLIVDAGDDIEDLFKLCKADITSKNPNKVRRVIKGFESVQQKVKMVEERDKLRNWKNPISGDHIMQFFGIEPSREIGVIKEHIKEAIMNGEIENDFDMAYELMKKVGTDLGLTANKKL